MRDIARYLIAADRERRRVAERSLREDRDIGRPGADVD
jgi:hypothetical protein